MGGQRRPPLQRVRVGNTHSDLHQFLFLLGAHLVDLLDVLVGEILNVLFGLLLVVLGQFALLLGLLDVVDCVAADVADGDLGILGVFADLLRETLRRSSVSCGKTRRITRPSFCGLMPRSEV